LKRLHEKRKDKIIIYCDSVEPLEWLAKKLMVPYIDGSVKNVERNNIIRLFKEENSGLDCIIFSRVGDDSIDIPNANVII
jgi:DNA excision repair protein ERCC-3